MATNIGHIAATASLNIDPFEQSTRIIETQLRSLDKALRAQEISFKNSGKSISSMKSVYDQTGKSITSYSALLEKQKARYEELKNEIGDVNTANSEQKRMLLSAEAAMNTTVGKIEELTGSYNRLGREIAIQESGWTKAGNVLGAIGDKATAVGKQLGTIGGAMTKGLTVPIVAGVTMAVKSAIEFESAFAGVKKTVDEVYDANGNLIISYEDLSNGIREMSKNDLPATTTEISEVAEAAGQLGIQTENILSFSKTMIDMGESTNLSADAAATALARFANITGMNQDKFSNLGASIVDLGNNFATTESDIVNLSMRLAGAGSQVGMSEADILGLSAALSSVGIEAEMGGSALSKTLINMSVASATGLDAMRDLENATGLTRRELELMANHDGEGFKAWAIDLGMTTTEMKNVMAAGKDLEGFAAIAGMTGEQFKQAFEQDAVGALGAFIEGLGSAEEKGTTAIELLDELGISEVRLRDSLLRAGNASELFAEAIGMSNTAFEENTALTEEAEKRYETTESKLRMLKNQVNDLAIEFGGPFVDALRDGLEAATPLIDRLGEMARAFSEASPETQQMIVKTLAYTAAAGPMLSIMSKIFTTTGSMFDGISKTSKKIGEMSGAAKASKIALDASNIGMVGATGSAVKLTAGIGAIATPLLIVGGVLAAGTIAWKLWGEEAYESGKRTRKWGTDIGEVADEALNDFQTLSDEASLATDTMMFNIEGGAERAITAYSSMAENIKEDIQGTITATEEGLADLPESVRSIVEKSLTKGIAEQTKYIEEIDVIQAKITGIYEKALAENREITDNELTVIENYHTRMAEIRSETLNLSAEDQKKVMAVMRDDLATFSQEQLRDRMKFLGEEHELIKERYFENQKLLEDSLVSGELSRKEYNDAMQELNREEIDELMVIGAEYKKVWDERGDIPSEIQEKILNDMGLSLQDVNHYLALHNDAVAESGRLTIETSENASKKVREANNVWNDMVLDGEENMRTFIQSATESEQGWNDLEYVIHNAELDSNSKQIIKDAMMANGTWWDLEFPPHWAEVDSNVRTEAKAFLESEGVWQGLDLPVQTAILDSNSKDQVKQILIDYDIWNGLDYRRKTAFLGSNTKEVTTQATHDHATWEGQDWSDKQPKINATTNARDVARFAQAEINSVTGKTVSIVTRRETVYSSSMANSMNGPYATYASGTNFHKGGHAFLGDGGRHEPYLTPQGYFGVSPADWTLYDLPRGTKVWPSIEKFMSTIPKFAGGTEIGETKLMQAMSRLKTTRSESNNSPSVNPSPAQIDYGRLSDILATSLMKALENADLAFLVGETAFAKLVGNAANISGAVKTGHKQRGLAGN